MLTEAKPQKEFAGKVGFDPVRWRLLFITSFAAAVIALALWIVLAIVIFGGAPYLARNQSVLFSSVLLPLGLAAAAGFFTYRHTARRRKTQAILSVIMTLVLFSVAYAGLSRLFPENLSLRDTLGKHRP